MAQFSCGSVCICVVEEDAQRLFSVIYHLSSKANHNDFRAIKGLELIGVALQDLSAPTA